MPKFEVDTRVTISFCQEIEAEDVQSARERARSLAYLPATLQHAMENGADVEASITCAEGMIPDDTK